MVSGIISGCGLLDSDGNVIEGGIGVEMKDQWIGDPRLHWLVNFKGSNFWLKCSDFYKYNIGERGIILKSGTSKSLDQKGNLVLEPACRGPVPWGADYPFVYKDPNGEMFFDPISDSNVAYTLDRGSDILVPVKFW